MSGSPRTCTVLFVDISGSTRLYEELGDAHALTRVASCLRLLQRAADELQGRVVKSTGDGLMCAFVDADAALQAARAMHVRVLEQTGLGGPALGIHVGCHHGAGSRTRATCTATASTPRRASPASPRSARSSRRRRWSPGSPGRRATACACSTG
jgi:class 3 adenylate cyclase